MSKKLYQWDNEGGIVFASERKPWTVCIPIFVYDIWLPLLGVEAIGVYSVYCRLEMAGEVKKITQSKLAQACRIGTRRLALINEMLADCGFIEIEKPQGYDRLKHFTTRVILKDPPQTIAQDLIQKYHTLDKSDYEPLTVWLVADNNCQPIAPEMSNDNAGDVKQQYDAMSNDNAKIESLGIEELGGVEEHPAPAPVPDIPPVLTAGYAQRILDMPVSHKRFALAGVRIPLIDAYSEAIGAPYIANEAEKTAALEATIAGYTADDMRTLVQQKAAGRSKDKPYLFRYALSDLAAFKTRAAPRTIGKVLDLDGYEYDTPEYWDAYNQQMAGGAAS